MSGDTTITARLFGSSRAGAGGGARMGLMIRESLAPDAKTQAMVVGDEGFRVARFGTRAEPGSAMTFMNGNAYTGPDQSPSWYRLERNGDTFTAYQSGDGVTWFTVGSSTVPMADVVQVGFAVASASAVAITGFYDHVSVTGQLMPSPPNLMAINGHAQVTLNWNASPGADGYDLKRASVSGGPYTLIAPGLTDTSYVDAGLTDGTPYYYVVVARQGAYESVDSNVAAGLPGDITGVWSANPSSANWSLGANWFGGQAPGNGDSLAFAASAVSSLTNDLSDLAINRLTFNAGAAAFTLAGNPIKVAGDISNQGAAAQTLTLNLALAATPTINASTGALALRGVVTDAGTPQGFVKAGTQALFVSGLNTFSGDVRLTAGSLSIAGVGTGSAGAPTAGALGRGTVRLAGGTLTSSAAATIYNTVLAEAGTTSGLSSAVANLTLAGGLAGSGNITESGANTGGTHFNGDNSGFSGTFTSSNATNHRIRFNLPGAGSAAATWVLNNSQTDGNGLNFGTGTIHFGALSGGGQFRNDAALNTTATLSIGALNTNTTFTGVMVANSTRFIAVNKVGAGTLTFTGNHTYNGPTTVTAGALYVNGGFASPVTVTGGTFGGTGNSNAPVTVNAGGNLAPGNLAVGTFTTSAALTLNSGATYALQLNSGTSTADRIVANGVTLAGASLNAIDLGSENLPGAARFTIIDNTGANPINGTFAGLAEGATFTVGANLFRITYTGGSGNDLVLAVVLPATVTLGGLTQIYDGTPKPAIVSTTPAELAVSITYDGSAVPPTHAGSYAVVATVTDASHEGSATGTLVIGRAPASVILGNLSQTYDGSPKPVTLTTSPAGLPAIVTYGGDASAPANAGSYAVTAAIDDPNYEGSATGTLVIAKTSAVVLLADLIHPYDGTPKSATASTVPGGLAVDFTYDGDPSVPVYPGHYSVIGTVNDTNYAGSATGTLVISPTALVRHMTSLNGGIDGSVQVLAAENITLNGSSWISGDLLVVGRPAIRLNGSPTFGGTLEATGSVTPANRTITLNGDSVLRHVVRRIDPQVLPTVNAPPMPAGTRSVSINSAAQNPGDFATLRNLTLNSNVGQVFVPAGTYGNFIANSGSGFTLGVAGATEPAIYNLQKLTLNGGSELRIVGPVVINLNTGSSVNSNVLLSPHPVEWLTLTIASGGLSLNDNVSLRGTVIAPSGTITLNDNSTLIGQVVSDRLIVNSDALLEQAIP